MTPANERRKIMSRLNLSAQEEEKLLVVLERYLPDLSREIADTDKREFRHNLQERETFMTDLVRRLKN
jgi:hypothetical protein